MTDDSARRPLPPVMRAATVNQPRAETFRAFTEQIGAWWPLPTHGLFGPESASVSFRDGLLIEQSIDGREAVWAHVLEWDAPVRVLLAWHPGREQDDASQVDVFFEEHGESTRVVIEHHGWDSFGDDAAARRLGYVGPNAWGYVLDHFADGAEQRADAVDTSGLQLAYDAFFDEAGAGGFGSPDPGQWTAEETIAHVALNDASMLAVCQAIVHQNTTRFENEVCHDRRVLREWIEAAGDMPGLIDRGRATANLVVAALGRLSPDQLQTLVHCRLLHEGEIMVDRELPWVAVAVETQASMHLPAHVQQLQNLRT